MNVVGLDLSLTSTGVADGDGTRTIKSGDRRGVTRLIYVREQIVDVVAGADLVVIEGYSYASKFSHAHSLGELGGLTRVALCERDIPFAIVAPTQLKKYVLGKGGGKGTDKDAMGIAAMKRAALDFSGRNDECDAWWLRAMGCDHLGEPVVAMPAAHRAVLDTIDWPAARKAVAG